MKNTFLKMAFTAVLIMNACSSNSTNSQQEYSSASNPTWSSIERSSSSMNQTRPSSASNGKYGDKKYIGNGFVYLEDENCKVSWGQAKCAEKGTLDDTVEFFSESGDWPYVNENLYYIYDSNNLHEIQRIVAPLTTATKQYNPCISLPSVKFVEGNFINRVMFPDQKYCDEFKSR